MIEINRKPYELKSSSLELLSGNELINPLKTPISEFWKWAYSDLLDNTTSATFAEFLVANVLELTNLPRVGWDCVDLRYKGLNIEIKTSSYLQSWEQHKISDISFDISRKRGWDNSTYKFSEAARFADIFIFCIYAGNSKGNGSLMNCENWKFYIVNRETIDEKLGSQKKISLSKLQSIADGLSIFDLRENIDSIAAALEQSKSDNDSNLKVYLHINWPWQEVVTYLNNASPYFYKSIELESQAFETSIDDYSESSLSRKSLGSLKPYEFIILDQTDNYELDYLISISFTAIKENGESKSYSLSIPKFGGGFNSEKKFNPILNRETIELTLNG